ncbi:putative RNA-directed DNA polymerase [Helianthus annuus]|nr:putative RNA-directed DNA polymerase [Helianthus annuus]
MHKPLKGHMQLAMRLLRYLKKAPGLGVMVKSSQFQLNAYANSGYCVFLGESLVSWKGKKQSLVARSSTKAKYRSMCDVVCEVIWLANVLRELYVDLQYPVLLRCDNIVALSIALNPVFHDKTKHFEVDLFFLREKIAAGIIKAV